MDSCVSPVTILCALICGPSDAKDAREPLMPDSASDVFGKTAPAPLTMEQRGSQPESTRALGEERPQPEPEADARARPSAASNKAEIRAAVMTAAISAGMAAIKTIPNAGAGASLSMLEAEPEAEPEPAEEQQVQLDRRAAIMAAAMSAGLDAIKTIPNAGAGTIKTSPTAPKQERSRQGNCDVRAAVTTAAIAAGRAAIATVPDVEDDGQLVRNRSLPTIGSDCTRVPTQALDGMLRDVARGA